MISLQNIPQGYAYCFAGKDSCPKASSCLRAIAAKLLAESKDLQPKTLNVVHSLYIEQLSDQASCSLYRSSEPLRYAKGMTHLFDELPLKQASSIRNKVIGCFSCERYFYHSRKGNRPISPEEQQKIARVFQAAGIGIAPKFDSYEYAIAW